MGSSQVVSSYTLRPHLDHWMQAGNIRLLELVKPATEQLLQTLWDDEMIIKLGTSKKTKSYKIINEKNVRLVIDGKGIYFPSRIRRGIAEQVGRILRSQYKRKRCFELVRELLTVINPATKLNVLVKQVAYSLKVFHKQYFKWTMIKQTIRFIKRWVLKYRLDIRKMSYTMLVRPKIQSAELPYGPDDGQAIVCIRTHRSIIITVKLPLVPHPVSERDWIWRKTRLALPARIKRKIGRPGKHKLMKPTLRYMTLKGGMVVPVFQFAWKHAKITLNYEIYSKKRVLAVDLGLVNVATSVVCEAGSQLTTPYFFKADAKRLQRIERYYELIEHLQSKLTRYAPKSKGQGRRQQEVDRLYTKLNHCRQQDVYTVIRHILELARHYRCAIIAIEDLRFYEAPKGKSKMSRKLSNWVRGLFAEYLQTKAKKMGFKVLAVDPAYTSTLCPRCGLRGKKIREPEFRWEDPKGRYFLCPGCNFCGDRDYVGALNVYRRYELEYNPTKKQKELERWQRRLQQASPVLYRRTDSPPNRYRWNV